GIFVRSSSSGDLAVHGDWHIEIRQNAASGTGEFARGNSNDGEGLAIYGDAATDHLGICSKTSLPESVAEYDDGSIANLHTFLGREGASERCVHSEHGEVVTRHQQRPFALGRATGA